MLCALIRYEILHIVNYILFDCSKLKTIITLTWKGYTYFGSTW